MVTSECQYRPELQRLLEELAWNARQLATASAGGFYLNRKGLGFQEFGRASGRVVWCGETVGWHKVGAHEFGHEREEMKGLST